MARPDWRSLRFQTCKHEHGGSNRALTSGIVLVPMIRDVGGGKEKFNDLPERAIVSRTACNGSLASGTDMDKASRKITHAPGDWTAVQCEVVLKRSRGDRLACLVDGAVK